MKPEVRFLRRECCLPGVFHVGIMRLVLQIWGKLQTEFTCCKEIALRLLVAQGYKKLRGHSNLFSCL